MNKEFSINRDIIDATPIQIIDDDWEFTDKLGHLHRWQNSKLPSLTKIIDCPADEEYPESFHFICKRCGEIITPQYKSPECREWTIVNTHYCIDGVEVTKKEFGKQFKQPH